MTRPERRTPGASQQGSSDAHRQAEEIVAAFDRVAMDFTDSAEGWRYGGGRDLSRLAEQVARRR